MTPKIHTVDLSTALKIKSVLNSIRNFGFVTGSVLMVLSAGNRWLLVAVVVFFAGSVMLARGSRAAAIVLVLTALMLAGFFERDARRATQRFDDRLVVEDRDPSAVLVDHSARGLIALNRKIVGFWVGLSVFYLGTLVLTAAYRRRAPRPWHELGWRRRLALRAAMLRVRMTPRAMVDFALALVCALIVLAPALVVSLGLILHVPRTADTAPVIDWAYDYDGPRFVITLLGVFGCLYFLVRAKRHAGLTVRDARELDPRPPILLLRSFEDDTTPLEQNRDQSSWKRSLIVPTTWTLEETVEQVLRARGPVIAIGRPGESVPPAGAAREYLANDEWQARVRELIEQARWMVIVLGDTEGLRFEYQTLLDQGASPKLILLFPPRRTKELISRWRRFCDVFVTDGDAPEIDLSRVLAARIMAEDAWTVVGAHRRDDEDCYRMALDGCLAGREQL